MCNQNVISNKFDLNLSTTLSSYVVSQNNCLFHLLTSKYNVDKAGAYPSEATVILHYRGGLLAC